MLHESDYVLADRFHLSMHDAERGEKRSEGGKRKFRSMTHIPLQDAASREVSHLQEVVIFLRIVGIWPDLAVNVGEWIGGSVVGKERRSSETNWPFDLRCQEIGGWSCAAALNVRDLVILGNGGGNLKQYHCHSSTQFCSSDIRDVLVCNSFCFYVWIALFSNWNIIIGSLLRKNLNIIII